jgi:uncharacterized membrane protein (DUF485 family)
MTFREKSAWIMFLALLVVGVVYFYLVGVTWSESGQLAQPMLPQVVIYTVCLVVLAVISHIVIAIMAPKEADMPADEREKQVIVRAGHYSSYVLAAGVVLSLGLYLYLRDGDLLFYTIFASLMAGQIAEYVLQITFYRTAI